MQGRGEGDINKVNEVSDTSLKKGARRDERDGKGERKEECEEKERGV